MTPDTAELTKPDAVGTDDARLLAFSEALALALAWCPDDSGTEGGAR